MSVSVRILGEVDAKTELDMEDVERGGRCLCRIGRERAGVGGESLRPQPRSDTWGRRAEGGGEEEPRISTVHTQTMRPCHTQVARQRKGGDSQLEDPTCSVVAWGWPQGRGLGAGALGKPSRRLWGCQSRLSSGRTVGCHLRDHRIPPCDTQKHVSVRV